MSYAMITRFNADSKSKARFTAGERLAIGAASMIGISHGAAKEAVDVSRTYYYKLGQKVMPLLECLTATGEIARSAILVTKEFIERSVIALHTVCNTSESAIQYFMEQVCGVKVSKGKIYAILKAAEEKAAAYDAGVSLEGIGAIATDETFQGNRPVLTGVDPRSGYVFMAEPAEDRSGATWQAALEKQKEKGLDAKLNISDEGTGLLKGVQAAFPGIEMQPDIFHAMRELGREINAIERTAMGDLSDYCSLEYRIQNPHAHFSTRQKYNRLRLSIDDRLVRADSLRILHRWLVEYTNFTGYGYEHCLKICGWILDEMSALYPKSARLLDSIAKLRTNLPDVLGFLPRLRQSLITMAREYHVPDYAFTLMYSQLPLDVETEQYQLIEDKLYHLFRERFLEAKEALHERIHSTYRASSPVENVNGRFRVIMNVQREIPDEQFSLLKMMMNTKKCSRSRVPERIGNSALDRLTGQNTPDFLDALLGPPHYIFSAV